MVKFFSFKNTVSLCVSKHYNSIIISNLISSRGRATWLKTRYKILNNYWNESYFQLQLMKVKVSITGHVHKPGHSYCLGL